MELTEEKKQEMQSEIDYLYTQVKLYKSSNSFYEMINFVKKFPRVAPFNAMLVHMQKPGSQYFTTASIWKKQYDRVPKKSARPLLILKMFGPVDYVFELNDTEGKEVPEGILNPFRIRQSLEERNLYELIHEMRKVGIDCSMNDFGTGSAGKICVHEGRNIVYSPKLETTVKTVAEIVVNSNLSCSEQYATILHELGHFFCGHLGNFQKEGFRMIPGRSGVELEIKEFEAETVCWLICERMGLDNPSAKYLNGYLGNNDSIPYVSIDAIMKAVGLIESLITKRRYIEKNLIIGKNSIDKKYYEAKIKTSQIKESICDSNNSSSIKDMYGIDVKYNSVKYESVSKDQLKISLDKDSGNRTGESIKLSNKEVIESLIDPVQLKTGTGFRSKRMIEKMIKEWEKDNTKKEYTEEELMLIKMKFASRLDAILPYKIYAKEGNERIVDLLEK